ncbi:MAG: antibiotic biosynthesis monooxygenase [Planctomycetia bacterium]|nr:antibiotic biosynthesis monooxygenase [Planctomycetia bacterium]
MFVACVHVEVIPHHRDDFIAATLENARNTVREPGNLRFDMIQNLDDPNKFMLYEVYRDEEGMAAHKKTAHYLTWRDQVALWFTKARERSDYFSLFPETPEQWATNLDEK